MPNERPAREVRLQKVVSGGQTGVDRAALDAAMDMGIDVGGWCPHGRRAEDGPIDRRYPLKETPSAAYAERTTYNVRDSDGTLVLASEDLFGGTAFTVEEARRLGRPLLVVNPVKEDVEAALSWLQRHEIRILNVAGPRESSAAGAGTGEKAGIYAAAYGFLRALLDEI